MREEPLAKILAGLGVTGIHRARGWLNGHCPFAPFVPEHRNAIDSNPSFGAGINDRGVSSYYCFTCKQHGIISGLARSLGYYRKTDYSGLALEADKADMDVDFLPWDEITIIDDKPLQAINLEDYERLYPSVFNFELAQRYLISRNIRAKAARRLDLRFHVSEQRIVFPVYGLNKKLYGFSGRTLLEPHEYPVYASGRKFPKIRDFAGLAKEKLILGAELWKPGKPVLIQEGLVGHGYFHQLGADKFFNLGATMGARLTAHQASILIEFGEPVYLLYDNDPAGDAALWGETLPNNTFKGGGAVDKLYGQLPIYLPCWPENKEDPDELTLQEISTIIANTELFTG